MTEHDPPRPDGGSSEPDLDRLVARSLAASERGSRASAAAASSSRSPWPWVIAALLLALLLGMVANPWFERQLRGVLPNGLQEQAAIPPPAMDMAPVNARIAALEEALQQARQANSDQAAAAGLAVADAQVGAVEGRLAALEGAAARLQAADATATERLDRLVEQVAALSGGGSVQQNQMRELLLLFASRRLFEQGRLLTPLMPGIEARFGNSDPEAVAALAAWNSAPVTRQSLATRLETDMDSNGAMPADTGWWQSLRQRLSGLVEVRVTTSRPEAVAVAAASEALRAGDLEQAIERMSVAGRSEQGDDWLADARRLQAAETAMARIDLAATEAVVQAAAPPAGGPAAAAAPPVR